MLIGEAKDLESLNEGMFKQLFNIIQKKYSAINKQLIKYADSSLKAISDAVTEFKEGDYYQVDIDSVQHILEIAKANHEIVLKALQSTRK
jgi:hypothetical protein